MSRKAFTLVEILITLTLLSIMLVIVYEIMGRMFQSGTVTQWETVLTTSFTNADSRLRDYLNASGYPSMLTPQGNAVLNYDPAATPPNNNTAFLLGFPSSGGNPPTATINDFSQKKAILTWFRCKDGRIGIEGLPNQPPEALQISLVVEPAGTTKNKGIPLANLTMEEAPVNNLPATFDAFSGFASPSIGNTSRTLMVADVREVTLKLFSRTSGNLALPSKDRVQVEVEIKCVEPTQANAERSRKITAEANVGAKPLS